MTRERVATGEKKLDDFTWLRLPQSAPYPKEKKGILKSISKVTSANPVFWHYTIFPNGRNPSLSPLTCPHQQPYRGKFRANLCRHPDKPEKFPASASCYNHSSFSISVRSLLMQILASSPFSLYGSKHQGIDGCLNKHMLNS